LNQERITNQIKDITMSKVFEKLIKEAVKKKCEIIQLENESEGFVIYLISNGSGFQIELEHTEIYEIMKYLKKIRKLKGCFDYLVDSKKYNLCVKFSSDFGEEVFTLKINFNRK